MDTDRALVSKVAQTGCVEKYLALGISDIHFADNASGKEALSIWNKIVEHTRKYSVPPSFETVREYFPDYKFDVVTDSSEYVADAFMRAAKRRFALQTLYDLSDIIDDNRPEDIDRIDELFLDKARDLSQITPSLAVSKYSEMKKRINDYHAAKWEGGHKGIPFGVNAIDNLTLGIHRSDLVSISGYSGRGKSTLMQWLAFNAYVAGHTPLVISLEMDADAMFRRWDTMATHFKYFALKELTLDNADVRKWEEAAERAEKAPNDIVVLDTIGSCTVERVFAEMTRYKPDVCAIDYVQLMDARGNAPKWEKITEITKGLKANARTLKTPTVMVTQANRDAAEEGAGESNVANSLSIFRDSDIMLGLHRTEEMKEAHEMELRLIKNRDGATANCRLHWDMNTMTFGDWAERFGIMARQEATA